MNLYNPCLLIIIIYLLSEMSSLPFYIFHSDISTRGARLDLGRPIEHCGYGSGGEVTRLVLGR